jgi:LPS-assembly protein
VLLLLLPLLFFCGNLAAQTVAHPQKSELPSETELWFHAIDQESNGEWRYLKGSAKIRTSEFDLSADEIKYNSDTDWAYARGHVHLAHFQTGDELRADHAEYNLKTQEGKFYVVDGTSPAKIITSPGVLTTTNPFYFKAQWAERIKNRYVLHHGFLTDCKVPKPWWTFQAPVFDIVPGERAIARHTLFRLKRVPIFYLPYFYRPLGKNSRQSGFLTPNFGNSSRYGYMYGGGYYWAINRSYDTTAMVQYFTTRGPALRYDLRGKPNAVTDFDLNLYGVKDRGFSQNGGPLQKQGGVEMEITGRTEILGFTGRLDYNYLSSYLFRQAFSYSFASAITSQVYSVGYLQRHFKDDLYTVNIVAERNQLFQAVTPLDQPANQVVIQKLPSFEFLGRDREVLGGRIPVWFSFESTASLLNRQEPPGTTTGGLSTSIFSTGILSRTDVQPRVMTQFSFKGFSLNPSITFGATAYSKSYATNSTTYTPVSFCGGYPTCPPAPTTFASLGNTNLFRRDADFVLDFRTPSLAKIFAPPKWLHVSGMLKHVIQVQATYEIVTGVNQFQKVVHFDATDIISNTNQLTVAVTNRLYRKDKQGNVSEVLTWRVAQARYFDPTFGGAVLAGQRNIILAQVEISPIAFLDGPRNYSPIVSTLTASPYSFFSIEWRADYDPLRKKFVDHTINSSFRYSKYFVNLGETAITTNPLLVPQANQLTFGGGYGNSNRKGWNAAALIDYDVIIGQRLFSFVQTSYNTDCCGFSFQIRSYNLGIRNENQYLFSFSVANIGTFGSMQKQDRIF